MAGLLSMQIMNERNEDIFESVEVVIDCVAFFYEEGKGGENYRKKNKFRCCISNEEKRVLKLREIIW
jgi:hypothetical protein